MAQNKNLTLKGFRDFLPQQMVVRNAVIGKIRNVFEQFGFEELQTPTLELQDVLLGKYGEEAEKLMYLFEDQGKRPVGMKYDLTVPLARVISSYNELPSPFKRYQIQPVWRAENTQKGRYREFYQCDVDIVGSKSPLADAEILAVINSVLSSLDFKSFSIRVNSRSVLFKTMADAKVDKQMWLSVIQSIDKLDKKSQKDVENELEDKKLSQNQIKKIFELLKSAKPDEFLSKTISHAYNLGVSKNNIVFDPVLSRGLDYYTGPIFESVVKEPKIGSLTGGGRYDELIKTLGGPDLPATGTTIGLERIIDVITELDLLKQLKSSSKILVTVFEPKLLDKSIEVATLLRSKNINTELYPDETVKLDKQLKYANKKSIPFVVIIGPEEAKNKKAVLKNMTTGEQKTTDADKLASLLN